MLNWKKMGLILNPQDNPIKGCRSHAALPVCFLKDDTTLRIYYSFRDSRGRSQLTSVDVDPKNPSNVISHANEVLLPLGEQGSFDDNGIMPSCVIRDGDKVLLYYIGWNPQVTVSYRLSIGLAVSFDDGATFEKVSQGPIADRSIDEPFFNTAPFVLKESDNNYKMWYVSCTGWKVINDWPEPLYNVKYATSTDGTRWHKTRISCIDYDEFTHAIGKPVVFREDGLYKMFYSFRHSLDYRTDPARSYRLGYAESVDGTQWQRKDSEMGIKFSDDGWDSVMQEYCSTYVYEGKRYLVYNGNGFGESGFGYAILGS